MIDNAKDITELKIFRQNVLAGYLRRTQHGCAFDFDNEFLNNPRFHGLSYQMPKTRESIVHAGVNLHPFFAGLLPEGLRLRLLVKQLKTSEDDLFTLFAAAGTKSVGDVYAATEDLIIPDIEAPASDEVNFYKFFFEQAEAGHLELTSDSIAGVQEKISASMISLPLHIAERHKSYILKLNPGDKPNLVQNEKICLALAHHCGIRVNNAKLIYDKNRNPGLLVERFDRIEGDNLQVSSMLHQEDACQFLDYYPADKYRLSLREIAEGMAEICSAPKIDLLRLLQIYAFSYLIGNGDLHAKNISIYTHSKSGRISLTPAYDLLTTYIYKDHQMAMKLDGRDDNLKRSNFIAFGTRLGVSDKAINQMLNRLLTKFKKHAHMLYTFPLTEKQKSLLKTVVKKRAEDLS